MISISFSGLLLLIYFVGMFVETVNNAAIISLAMYDTKMGVDDFTPVDIIKIIFFTVFWPIGLVIKVLTALDHFAIILGRLEEMDAADKLDTSKEPEPDNDAAIVGPGLDDAPRSTLTGYETTRLPAFMLGDVVVDREGNVID